MFENKLVLLYSKILTFCWAQRNKPRLFLLTLYDWRCHLVCFFILIVRIKHDESLQKLYRIVFLNRVIFDSLTGL